MKISRVHLLAACAASTFVASAAQAQVALPPIELRGAGATTIADVLVRSLNCIGNPGNHVAGDLVNNRLNKYFAGATSNTIAPASFAGPPAFNCETDEIQPDFQGKYLGVGSGAGRQVWSNFNFTTPTVTVNGHGVWPNVQFAFSEAPALPADITTYNANANSAANGAGAAIQVPFYVIPIAFAYNPTYGFNPGDVAMKFNVKTPLSINGTVAGGLKLSRVAYCKIFNGEIMNWNDLLLKTLNSNVSLHDATNDTLVRWNAEGAPIRLVGRADRSGGTDVFTRAMAAQCDGLVTTNKFDNAAESLPYDNTSPINITKLRADSRYNTGVAASNFSGPIQSLGGLVYDNNAKICKWDELNASRVCDTTLAPGGVLTNAPTPGLFLVADGSSRVALGIARDNVDPVTGLPTSNGLVTSTIIGGVVTPATAGYKFNGKLGYVGADFVTPVPGRTLFAAALQKGTTAAYVMPTTTNASAAFGTVLPPQSIAASGAYSTADARTFGSVNPYLVIDPVTNPATPVSRANPLHWSAVLYNPNGGATLANPLSGYPITGAAFLLTSTCFKPANSAVPGNNANRFGMVEFMGLTFGKITRNSLNVAISANLFKGTSALAPGILTQSNTALPSAGWQTAINDTFLKKSVGAAAPLGALNLWIQDTNPTTALDVDGVQQATDSKSNPSCDATKGA
jgi:ABC-type phosphate transport system substrate-binding protein